MERWADWAPTRPLLAYSRGKDIFVAEVGEGTAPPRRLVAAGRGKTMVRPIWAPDSSRLVVQRSNLRKLSKLWVADLEGATRQLTHDPDWFDSKTRFTRDGERIVYTRRPTAGGPRQLAVVPVEGGTPRPLFGESGADEHSASISPTRDELVFISDQSGRPQLHRADLAGGGRRQLSDIPGSVWAPHWSPDGERIVAIVREGLEAPRLRDQDALARIRVAVYDREGELLYEAPGFMPNWMPAWP